MISHHITDIMIGQTLQSMLVINLQTPLTHALARQAEMESPGRHISTRQQQKSRQTEKKHTDAMMAESHSWVDWRQLGEGCDQFPRKERWPPLLCKNGLGRGGTSQQIVAEVCVCVCMERCWAGVEGGHPCKTGLWEAGRVEVKREQGKSYLVVDSFMISLETIYRIISWFSSIGFFFYVYLCI